jgi:hypothetical protein
MPRDGFTSDRFATFVARFEARTGERANFGNAGQQHG